MNDGFDPLYSLRSYDCPKSRAARDKWLAYREAQSMPVRPMTEKHAEPPGSFMRQYAKARALIVPHS
jgi:hypothetical protein